MIVTGRDGNACVLAKPGMAGQKRSTSCQMQESAPGNPHGTILAIEMPYTDSILEALQL
jgi:hypothetical protein